MLSCDLLMPLTFGIMDGILSLSLPGIFIFHFETFLKHYFKSFKDVLCLSQCYQNRVDINHSESLLDSIGLFMPLTNGKFISNSSSRPLRFTSRQANEPTRDKINKMTVLPAETKISLGIRPV